MKMDFAPLDEGVLLSRVAALPISQWRYKSEPLGTVHVGPVAEDFRDLFGLGDGAHLSTVDVDGVALASIKALYREMQQRDQEIVRLQRAEQAIKDQLARDTQHLSERLAALEALLNRQLAVKQ